MNAPVTLGPTLAEACDYAAWAYMPPAMLAEQCKAHNIGLIQTVAADDDSVHCYLAMREDGIIIQQFRGTDCWRDALIDAMAIRAQLKLDGPPKHDLGQGAGAVHGGIYQAWLAIKDKIDPVALCQRPVYIGGHSMGAGLAYFAALRRAWTGLSVSLRTFGCPRIGDAQFVRGFNRYVPDHVRVVHADDIVPRVPCGFGYEHPAGLLHLDDDGSAIGPIERFWLRIIAGIVRVDDDLDGQAIRQHFMVRYQDATAKYCARNP